MDCLKLTWMEGQLPGETQGFHTLRLLRRVDVLSRSGNTESYMPSTFAARASVAMCDREYNNSKPDSTSTRYGQVATEVGPMHIRLLLIYRFDEDLGHRALPNSAVVVLTGKVDK
jgi:hypothetical protein